MRQFQERAQRTAARCGIGIFPRRDRTGQYEIRFTSAARKAGALRKLGVSADQIASVPQITPLLRDKRHSLKPVLLAMHLSPDPIVQCFLAKLLGAAMLALHEFGKTIAMSQYPDVLQKRIEYAMLPSGWRDRDAIDKLLGVLPIDY